MKQLLYLPAVLLISCSPRVQTSLNGKPALAANALVVVLDPSDRFRSHAEALGTINSSTAVCNYDEAINDLKKQARGYGANLVKIVASAKASECINFSAKLYRVDSVRRYERKFDWTADRKLTWEDFKGNPSSSRQPHVAATTSCRFGIRINPSFTVTVTNEFVCHQSSAKPEHRTAALLAHEQLHFDLCELYARMLRKELAAVNLNAANVKEVSGEAFLRTYKAYKERQALYDEETNHGLKSPAQERWKIFVEQALRVENQ